MKVSNIFPRFEVREIDVLGGNVSTFPNEEAVVNDVEMEYVAFLLPVKSYSGD